MLRIGEIAAHKINQKLPWVSLGMLLTDRQKGSAAKSRI